MAQAIITGLLNGGRSSSDILVSDLTLHAETLWAQWVYLVPSEWPAIAQADLIVLAVKPQIMDTVLAELPFSSSDSNHYFNRCRYHHRRYRQQLDNAPNTIVRVMPNTPALIGQGISALASDLPLDGKTKNAVQEIFNACGKLFGWAVNI